MDIFKLVEITAWTIVGIFSLVSLLDKALKTAKKEKDEVETEVITLLKEQVLALDRKVSEQSKVISNLQDKMTLLTKENKTMRDLLEHRDKESIEYRKAGWEAIRMGVETNGKVTKIEKNIQHLLKIIDEKLEIQAKR